MADLRKLCQVFHQETTISGLHIHDVSFPCLVTLAKFAEVRRSLKECSAHLQQRCASVERAGGQFGVCLRSAVASLSDTCKYAPARGPPRSLMVDNVSSGLLAVNCGYEPGLWGISCETI